jgi:hypothetical protein
VFSGVNKIGENKGMIDFFLNMIYNIASKFIHQIEEDRNENTVLSVRSFPVRRSFGICTG